MNQENNESKYNNTELDSNKQDESDNFQKRSEDRARNRSRMEKKRKRRQRVMVARFAAVVICFLALTIVVVGIRNVLVGSNDKSADQSNQRKTPHLGQQAEGLTGQESDSLSQTNQQEGETADKEVSIIEELVGKADRLESGYNQDAAIDLIKSYPDYESSTIMMEAIQRYEQSKAALAAYEDVTTIPHIFFHSLIADTAKAFDGDTRQDGYNQYMVTVSEFENIMQQMYDKGYVLVSIKDMAAQVTSEDGTVRFEPGVIMLPPGKKPFVLSVDDVSYYEYMEDDGFASRIVLGENGRPTCEMKQDDGTTTTGNYDVVPCLEGFIEQHPDFSYKGARGILAVTGYDGVLGYRTDPSYNEREGYAKEYEDAVKVAQGLKDWGWEFASHSYGHIDMDKSSIDDIRRDTENWRATVEPIVGATDIFIYPFGSDIGGWQTYEGEKFEYLKSQNYRYFCNVDGAGFWVQIHDDYVRQGRRNIDGIRMYYDMIDDSKDMLSDLFDVNSVFDKRRPVPVPK